MADNPNTLPVEQQPPAPTIPPQQVVPVEPVKTFRSDETVEFPDGSKTTWAELQATRQELAQMREAGADLYLRAVKGDQVAMQEFLNRYTQQKPPVTTPVQEPPAPAAVDLQTLKSELMKDPMFAGIRDFVAQEQAQKSRVALQAEIGRPEFEAFAKRPDAVDLLVERLNAYYHSTGRIPDTSMIHLTLQHLNKQEQEYQEKLVAPFKQAAGDLGVSEPFRGGAPVQDPGARPDPKDRSKYAQWLSNKLKWAATTSGT